MWSESYRKFIHLLSNSFSLALLPENLCNSNEYFSYLFQGSRFQVNDVSKFSSLLKPTSPVICFLPVPGGQSLPLNFCTCQGEFSASHRVGTSRATFSQYKKEKRKDRTNKQMKKKRWIKTPTRNSKVFSWLMYWRRNQSISITPSSAWVPVGMYVFLGGEGNPLCTIFFEFYWFWKRK